MHLRCTSTADLALCRLFTHQGTSPLKALCVCLLKGKCSFIFRLMHLKLLGLLQSMETQTMVPFICERSCCVQRPLLTLHCKRVINSSKVIAACAVHPNEILLLSARKEIADFLDEWTDIQTQTTGLALKKGNI